MVTWNRWAGDWRFNNYMLGHLHGMTGTEEVEASTEESAREEIQSKVARQIAGTTMVHRYVDVSNLRKVSG